MVELAGEFRFILDGLTKINSETVYAVRHTQTSSSAISILRSTYGDLVSPRCGIRDYSVAEQRLRHACIVAIYITEGRDGAVIVHPQGEIRDVNWDPLR